MHTPSVTWVVWMKVCPRIGKIVCADKVIIFWENWIEVAGDDPAASCAEVRRADGELYGLSDGLIGKESKWALISRTRRETLPEVCLLEELRIKSQHRASRPKRLGNEILQMTPSRMPSLTVQSLDTRVMLMNFCFPKAEVLASPVYQFCCIQDSSSSAVSASLDTSCKNITSAAPVVSTTCSSADKRDFGNDAPAFAFQFTRRNEPAHRCLMPYEEVLSLTNGIHRP
jgi:hypothetical protein